jgi:phosphoglycolate phosphatase
MAGLKDAGITLTGIIFDKDGTLADSRPFLRQLAMARAQACVDGIAPGSSDQAFALYTCLCQTFGVTADGLDPDGLMAVDTRSANERAAIAEVVALGADPVWAQGLIPRLFAQVDRALAPKVAQTPPFPGTREMLSQLNLRPLKVGILSSDSSPQVKDFLAYYGFEDLVQAWRGTDAGDRPKPEPELFWQLCDRLQVDTRQTLMVGDSQADLEVARNAGAAGFVSVAQGWGRAPVPGADDRIQDWKDLLRLIAPTGTT